MHNADAKVPIITKGVNARPFVGVVVTVGGFSYYAPLASPKRKHLTMKNQLDFLKIDGGTLGAINFNNMIPVVDEYLSKIDLSGDLAESGAEKAYVNLLRKQLAWCRSNSDTIMQSATKLYTQITKGSARSQIKVRCCDFRLLEKKCHEFAKQDKASPPPLAAS